IWTEEIPLSADVDFEFLARQFKLSGGNIKNIALAAAFLAAEAGSGVMMEHLLQGTRREYQKMGKVWSDGMRSLK
ncbi:MAG: ATP-binding protein, partial [Moorea sp. SIO4G2]|nr:ATP-binding protein [Moorena sp. SIO4G2]